MDIEVETETDRYDIPATSSDDEQIEVCQDAE
jgi:hypothetical protein